MIHTFKDIDIYTIVHGNKKNEITQSNKAAYGGRQSAIALRFPLWTFE